MTSNRSIYGWMTLAAFCWAGAFIAGKLTVPYIPPLSLTFLRFLVATTVLFGVKNRVEQKMGTGMNVKIDDAFEEFFAFASGAAELP